MPLPQDHLDHLQRLRMAGHDTKTANLTVTALWGQSKKQARKDHKALIKRFALEATSLDILGELMLKFRQQEHHVDTMARNLKNDDLPASFHNTYRLALSACCNTLTTLSDMRDREGRNRCETPENEEDRKKEEARVSDEHFKIGERERSCGSFYHSGFGARQPGIDLLSPDLAVRDVLRMRMLPKSPQEDWILAQAFDCLTEEEKKINPDKLSKDEVVTDLHNWDPEKHATPGMTQYREYELLTTKLFLERIQNYNKVWADAEKHVDGLIKIKGIKPRAVHPYLGIPPIIQKAADGDPDAINELKAMVGLDCSPHSPSEDTTMSVQAPTQHSGLSTQDSLDPYEKDFGKACSILVALLLAFTSLWTTLTLIAGPTALALLMPIEATDLIPLHNEITINEIYRQDAKQAKNAKQNKHANPQTPWHSSAPWRFHSDSINDHTFFHAFSSVPSPSG